MLNGLLLHFSIPGLGLFVLALTWFLGTARNRRRGSSWPGIAGALAGAGFAFAVVGVGSGWFWLPPQALMLLWFTSALLVVWTLAKARARHPATPERAGAWGALCLAGDLWMAGAFLWSATVSPGGV